ncbi:extracellular solute-binding protein [Paenibacillus sp. GCM10027626]|uniref:extracellular solute-binding protein n=1 Tax=Paenibacillus sp. GCM10027626 TaxID=3273411 RepID=UPI00362F8B72
MKKKAKKLGLLSVIALTAIVTACGGNNGKVNDSKGNETPPKEPSKTETQDTGQTSDKEIPLTVQFPKSDNTIEIPIYEDKMNRFKEKYPNVTMTKNDWWYKSDEIGIKMAAHQAPSGFYVPATEGSTLVEHQWAADLTPFLANYEHAKEFNEKLTEQFTIDGKVYAVPKNGYIMSVLINKKLFADKNVALPSADWTWDDFYEAAKATADPAKGIAGFAIMAKGNEGGWNWTNFLYQAGGSAQKVEDGKVVSIFNSDAGVKAMEFMKKLRWEGDALPQNWALNYGDVYNLFKQSRAAIVLGNSGQIEDAVNNGGMNKDDLLLLPMPSMEKGGPHVGVLGGNYMIVNPQESPETQQAAFNFITFDMFNDSEIDVLKKTIEDRKSKGQIYTYGNAAYYYTPDSEFGKKMASLIDQYPDTVYKIDPEVIKATTGIPEAAYNGQEYYAAITNVMQEVFTNKDADVKALLDAAAKNFDSEVLSKVVVK